MITPQTWADYQQTKSKHIRDELILAYMPLVKYVASRLHVTLPPSIDKEDLESDGLFGLIEAIDRYDINRGVKFESYAVTRIRGSMIDKLRANDWVPRSVKGRIKELTEAKDKLQEQLDRRPTIKEVGDYLGVSEEWVRKVEENTNSTGVLTLDGQPGESDETPGILNLLHTHDDPTDSQETIKAVRKYLVNVLNNLSDRERIIFTLYYYEDLSLSEIGKLMGITESRVCQIHGKAIQDARLKFINNL